MTTPLPVFRYHRDPVATGSVVPGEIDCAVCGRRRDHGYAGPYVTADAHFENGDPLCPWCIADGSAARVWRASFVAPAYLSPQARAGMSADALAELELRTPAYPCLQQARWLDHHGEAATYLGEVGAAEYPSLPPAAREAVRLAAGDDPRRPLGDGDAVLRLRSDGDGPAAYLFACLHCEAHLAFVADG